MSGAESPEAELELVVGAAVAAAEGVLALTLRHPAGEPLPAWEPGAHIDLLLAPGLVRQYSLSGDPADRSTWRIGVLREADGRGGSAFVHDRLAAGARVRVRGPRSTFRFRPADRYLFIAGGIGITPILPMAAAAQLAGAAWTLLYGGRSRGSMAFTAELAGYGDRVALAPQDEVGLLDLDRYLAEPDPRTLVYCCGPGPLLDAVEERCRLAGWPSDALRVERFRPRAAAEQAAGDSFELVLKRSGRTLTVPPEVSILKALQDAGLDPLYSCGEGTCGTCETDVVEGEPDHRDSLLTEEERASGETMLICVSRCRGRRLVLDI